MGLAISHWFVERHNGTLTVQSTRSGMAQLSLLFCRRPNPKRSYPMKEHGDFLTILMADDNQDDCLVDFKR
jgi:hypothetical protein